MGKSEILRFTTGIRKGSTEMSNVAIDLKILPNGASTLYSTEGCLTYIFHPIDTQIRILFRDCPSWIYRKKPQIDKNVE